MTRPTYIERLKRARNRLQDFGVEREILGNWIDSDLEEVEVKEIKEEDNKSVEDVKDS